MMKLFKNMEKICPSCNRNTLLPYAYEWTCLICGINIIKSKNELTLITT